MAQPQPHILLLGGNGRISKMMIPLFLARGWSVTASIRDPKQTDAILDLLTHPTVTSSKFPPGKLYVFVHSLTDVKASKDAAAVLDKAKGVNWIVFSAGAGGEETPELRALTKAIDRDAAVAFAHAATHNPEIKRYLTVSAINVRRQPAEWWSSKSAEALKDATERVLPLYTEAKLVADECLTVWGDERIVRDPDFKYVVLRPSWLNDEPSNGENAKIQLGRTNTKEDDKMVICREDVARTADELLAQGANGWFDLVAGEELIKDEVERVVREGKSATSIHGQNEDLMKHRAQEEAARW